MAVEPRAARHAPRPLTATGHGPGHERGGDAHRCSHTSSVSAAGAATARTHVSHAMVKLGARDRAQLVVIAYQTWLVSRRP